jgi:predicted O-methyltransferase YrrM
VSFGTIPDKARKALYFARRRVLSRLASRETPARLDELGRFDHPVAAPLARALIALQKGDATRAKPFIRRIEGERAKLLSSREPLERFAESLGPYDRGLTVRDACLASRRPHDALGLYVLVEQLAPRRVLELGTNVGISSAYMAAALRDVGRGTIVTLEASPARSAIAKRLHEALELREVEYVLGLFDRTLESALGEPVDFVFVDGHHQYAPTLDYFDRVWKRSTEGTVFVFDDIRWSRDMERAWGDLQRDPRLRVAVDLCVLGIGIGTLAPTAIGRLVTPILSV